MVQVLQLKGHKSPVLSLAHSSDAVHSFCSNQKNNKKKQLKQNLPNTICHLLSGDEAGITRIWDLRYNSCRASHCILAPNNGDGKEVTAVGFHPLFDFDTTSNAKPMEGSCPFTVYTAVGNRVYGYDLRHTKSPSIISKHDFHVSSLDGGEEINNIDFFYMTKEKKTYLATADDDGMLRVADSIPNKKTQEKVESESSSQGPYRTYQHSDAGASALVTSLAFHPRSMKSIDIATAGTDCTICLWDISRPHNRPSSSLFIQQDNDDNAGKAGVSQVCNPPLVHALSWSPSGRLLSAGLGDGTCVIASVEGRKLVESCRLRDGHDSAVASVLFPRFNFSPHVTADDRLMISAGNDGSILLWDLGSTVAGSYAVDPATMFAGCEDDCKDISNAVKGLSLSQDPKILFGIPHNKKPNYMVSSTGEDTTLPNSLFIADTSHDITVYSLPRV